MRNLYIWYIEFRVGEHKQSRWARLLLASPLPNNQVPSYLPSSLFHNLTGFQSYTRAALSGRDVPSSCPQLERPEVSSRSRGGPRRNIHSGFGIILSEKHKLLGQRELTKIHRCI